VRFLRAKERRGYQHASVPVCFCTVVPVQQ
jgi:hypothetical protein